MKLISMHIDNFGGLHDYDYEFEDGLNVVLHDNGWGKTTMAAFLKAMLYGFDSKRSKDITENERKRYLPWQGGKYSGSLDFEAEGTRYRILRTFGETPRFDKVKILNLDTKTTAHINPEKIGETLFRLDASAFQRSVFINQNGLSIDGAASSIHTRLNALVSQANDVAAFDDAIAKLTAQIKVYEKTGARGRIGDITRQVTELERQRNELETDIAAQDSARNRILEIDVLLSTINEDLAEKKNRLDEVSGEAKTREASKKFLEDLKQQIAELQEKMDAIKSELGGRIPDAAEIEQVKRQKQSAAARAQQLAELEQSYAKWMADYYDLLEKYHGVLPAAEQLDEIQSVYGELQGIRSTGAEAAQSVGEEPEGYTLIKAVADRGPDYIDRLRMTVRTQLTVQEYIRKRESVESSLKHIQDSWADKKKRYAALSEEATRLQSEAEEMRAYNPDIIGPVITDMESLQKKQRILTQQIADQTAAIQRETDGWEEMKRRYASLKGEAERLGQEAGKRTNFATEKVRPVIANLEELQKLQQLVDVRVEELSGEALTAEQEALLAKYPGDLPDAAEGKEVLKKVRSIAQKASDVHGLEARRTGEQSKADSLQTSVDQLSTIPEHNAAVVEEPKKSAGTALIGVGAVAALTGAVLIFALTPIMAVVSAVGVVLAILGIASNNNYKVKLRAYEAYQASSAQRQESQEKKAALEKQLDAAKISLASLQKQIDDISGNIKAAQSSVNAWAAKWLSGSEATEENVVAVIDDAEQVAKLRQKRKDAVGKERFINEKTAYIDAERKKIEARFPEISGKDAADALEYLRSLETDYKLYAGQLKTAEHNLEKFFSESKITEEQLNASESPFIAEMRSKRDQANQELEEAASSRKTFDDEYPEIAGTSYDNALKTLRSKEGNYKVIEGQMQAAVRNLKKFLSDSGLTEEQFAAKEPPEMAGLTNTKEAVSQDLTQALENANKVLAPLEMDTDSAHILQALHEAEQMLNEYQQYADKLSERAGRQEKNQRQIDTLQKKLEDKLAVLQGRYPDAEIPDRLALIREETGNASKLKEKMAEAETDQKKQREELEKADEAVAAFISTYGHFSPEAEDILAEIYAKAASYAEISAAKQQLEKQGDNTNLAQKAENTAAIAEETELRTGITRLEERRDALRDEYAHKSDFIRQADQSLEKYPDVVQEIHQLYEQKQKAQNTLVMLKRTIQLITKAKENLANRYLSKVEQLFNNYMHIWMNNGAVRGILDIDFNVTIEEDEKVHVAEGYSTGYCDLIDFCMRLALVDTLFENEQPFLILDDPFVNLDADRLDKALELLNVMATSKQIVYFVCHPIRAAAVDEDSETRAEFVRLAEASRRTVENRKSTGAERKKMVRKSPREMYRVVNPDGAAAIKPAKPNYMITNNIFSLSFVLNDLGTQKDNAYELFFIDAVGHVLNDRQLIEIKDGKLSSEKVQFCLNTRDDSGDQYELMIRERGQDDYTVAARIPFRAKLAFAGTFSFDL